MYGAAHWCDEEFFLDGDGWKGWFSFGFNLERQMRLHLDFHYVKTSTYTLGGCNNSLPAEHMRCLLPLLSRSGSVPFVLVIRRFAPSSRNYFWRRCANHDPAKTAPYFDDVFAATLRIQNDLTEKESYVEGRLFRLLATLAPFLAPHTRRARVEELFAAIDANFPFSVDGGGGGGGGPTLRQTDRVAILESIDPRSRGDKQGTSFLH